MLQEGAATLYQHRRRSCWKNIDWSCELNHVRES